MRTFRVTLQIFFFLLLFVEAGCEPAQVGIRKNEQPHKSVNDCNEFSFYAPYTPVKIDIVPLTEFIGINDLGEGPTIKVYLSLLDSFGYQIKAPGIFRFELYERVPRSADPKGMARAAVDAMRQEYPEIEVEEAREDLAGHDLVGYDLSFFYLDLTNTARVRCLRSERSTLTIFCQAEDDEFRQLQEVFQAMTVSLLGGLKRLGYRD